MSFGLKEHIATILRHWGKALIVALVAVLVAGAVAFLSSKAYESGARVLILNRSPAEQVTNRAFDQSFQTVTPQEQVLTQVAIAQSPLLFERVAQRLGPERVLTEMRWKWDWLRELPGEIKDRLVAAMNDWGPTRTVLDAVGIRLPGPVEGVPLIDAAEKLSRHTTIEAIVKTDIFAVVVMAPSAEFAAETANTLIDEYVKHVAYLRRSSQTAELAMVETERLRLELRAAERALEDFSREHDILNIDTQKALLLDRLFRSQEELAQARGELLEAEEKQSSILARLDSEPRDEAVAVSTRPNPVVDSLRDRLAELQAEAVRFVPGSPAASRLRLEIQGIQTQLQSAQQAVEGGQTTSASELYLQLRSTLAIQEAERQALEVRVDFNERQVELTEAELRRLDQHETTYRELARNVQNKEQAFNYAMQKREETALADQISQSNFAIVVPVEPATPPDKRSSPRRGLLLALGIVVGTMGGLALTYAFEFARGTMSTPREAEIALGQRALGWAYRPALLSRRRTTGNAIEMRRLASRLLRERGTRQRLTALLTGPAGENLKAGFAEKAARELSVQGADVLRVAIALEPGRTKTATRIVDKDGKTLVAEMTERAHPRLDTATITGPAWAMDAAMGALLDAHGVEYGFVLIDPPGLDAFPEQINLARRADCVIPVVEADRTRTGTMLEAMAQFREAGVPILGLLFNRRRYRNSSWAFSWMALMRRRAFERSDRGEAVAV